MFLLPQALTYFSTVQFSRIHFLAEKNDALKLGPAST